MKNQNLLPEYDLEKIKQRFHSQGQQFLYSLVDNLKVNSEKANELKNSNSPVLYVANHRTSLDYFLPIYSILHENFPYPRTVAGTNLKHWLIKKTVFDFSEWGIFWVERGGFDRTLKKRVQEVYSQGESLLFFPEGTRNREQDLGNFKTGLFKLVAEAQEKMKQNRKVVCIKCEYENFPERDYYKKIDGHKRLGYYIWDAWAFLRWKYFERNKGTATIKFSKPKNLEELAEEGDSNQKVKNLAEKTREIILGM